MKYFDRHKCMSDETLDLIGMCKNQLITVTVPRSRVMTKAGNLLKLDRELTEDEMEFLETEKTLYFGSVSNMLAGLYDGFDYVDAIKKDDEMLLIQKQNPLLFWAINQVLKEVEGYPKTDKNLATY